MISEKLYNRFYDDDRYDGTLVFYNWIRKYASPETRILNFGAGPATRSPKRVLKGAVAEVIGADIDPIVLENGELDRAFLINEGKIDLEDTYFDIAFSDFVLEHVEAPDLFLAEIHRLLKPGGRFFFRTPNIYHYVSAISAFTPHWFHKRVANPVRGLDADSHEPWPTYYRMNSRASLRRQAESNGFSCEALTLFEAEPSYLMFHPVPFYLGVAYERAVNRIGLLKGFRSTILGCFVKMAP